MSSVKWHIFMAWVCEDWQVSNRKLDIRNRHRLFARIRDKNVDKGEAHSDGDFTSSGYKTHFRLIDC